MGTIKGSLGQKIYLQSSAYGRYKYSNFPSILLKSAEVKVEDLVSEMLPVFTALSTLSRKYNVVFVITSGKDSNVHKEGSFHYVGRAVDLSVQEGYTKERIPGWSDRGQIYQEFRKLLNPEAPGATNFDIIYESDPEHFHVEYDPHGKSKNSKTSTTPQPLSRTTGVTVSEQVPIQVPIPYLHTDPTIKSVSELIAQNPLFKGVTEEELLKTKNPGGLTNEEIIRKSYNNPDEDNKTEEWPLLKPGTLLFVLPKDLILDTLAVESTGQVKSFRSWGEYKTETQKFLDELPGYIPSWWSKSKDYSYSVPVKYINSAFRVWIYSKAAKGVVDVTPVCHDLQMDTGISGEDSFSLRLAFVHSNQNSSERHAQKVLRSNPFEADRISRLAREISENDIVFLSLEQLDCEPSRDSSEDGAVELSKMASQYYDFIGLVSRVHQSSDVNGGGMVLVSGESVSKLFRIDEAIFRPIAAVQNSFSGNIIIGDKKKRGWMERMFVDGQYHSLFAESFRTIERTMKYYLNLVFNVGLLPLDDVGEENTDLFASWGSERTRLFSIETDEDTGVLKEIQQEFARGIYQIVKLQFDPELGKRHLSDGAIFNPEGTIYSLMQAVCQAPLVEMLMDTYKNTFDIICRVPPFSKKALVEWSESLQVKGQETSYFGEINAEDVLSESFDWENNVYTWFELMPRGTIVPIDGEVSLCYIPTLFLEEFIEVWGSRSMSVVSPYSVVGSTNQENTDEIKQALQDLCWMVESYFYLPFTRRGEIILAVPDRRIKKGQWIRYKKTGELFYVEGVEQRVSVSSSVVNRGTVLRVSRGLLEKYINPKVGKGYFDIIDFEALGEQLKGFSSEGNRGTSLSAVVNKKLFRFFASRSQFLYEPERWEDFEK